MIHRKRTQKNLILLIFGLFIWSCQPKSFIDKSPLVQAMLNDPGAFFHIDVETYPVGDTSLPIGVFDSGTGGLTVLDAIVRFDQFNNSDHAHAVDGDGIPDFSREAFIYLADQANLPYGNYSRENKTDLLKEHILKDVQFLLGDKYYLTAADSAYQTDKRPVKVVVIACNTATAYGKSDIETFFEKADMPMKVIGVIDAGVRGGLNGFEPDEDGTIGVMATAGTVASMGYVHTLERLIEKEGYTGKIMAFQQAGIGLAGAIDGFSEFIQPDIDRPRKDYQGPSPSHPDALIDLDMLQRYGFDWTGNAMLWEGEKDNPDQLQINSVSNYIAYHVVSLMEKIRQSPGTLPLKTIILGCTHYPYYADLITERLNVLYDYQEGDVYLYRSFIAPNIELIDPALNTAKELYEYCVSTDLFNTTQKTTSEFYVSVPNVFNADCVVDVHGHFPYDYKYGRVEGQIQQYVKRIPFSRASIPDDVSLRLKEKIPQTFQLIQTFHLGNTKLRSMDESDKFLKGIQ